MKNRFLILIQFFLIIFVYHILKDLKDTVVITASDAGAEVIPFIKIWGMLPLALLTSYFFTRCLHYFGREKTLYIFIGILVSSYLFFAFCLYPHREQLFLSELSQRLTVILPEGCKGFIAMVSYWMYTLFYLSAELWSVVLLSILFWGYVNETTSLEEAKTFYPLCTLVGNCAGILSGQTSRFLCHTLAQELSWAQTLQIMIVIVTGCAFLIMGICRMLAGQEAPIQRLQQKERPSFSFKECISAIFQWGCSRQGRPGLALPLRQPARELRHRQRIDLALVPRLDHLEISRAFAPGLAGAPAIALQVIRGRGQHVGRAAEQVAPAVPVEVHREADVGGGQELCLAELAMQAAAHLGRRQIAALDDLQRIHQLAREEIGAPAIVGERRERAQRRRISLDRAEVRLQPPDRDDDLRRYPVLLLDAGERRGVLLQHALGAAHARRDHLSIEARERPPDNRPAFYQLL